MSMEANVVRKRKFVTEKSSEVTELTWEVKNFREIVTSTEEGYVCDDMDFEVGETIDLPTKWKFSIGKFERDLTFELDLLESPKDHSKVFASFHFTKNQHNLLWDEKGGRRNYKEKRMFTLFSEDMEELLKPTSKILVDDTLLIHIIFTIYNEKEQVTDVMSKDAKQSKFDQLQFDSRVEIMDSYQKLLDSGLKADLTLQMKDGKTLKAHAAILMIRSPVFFTMFQTEMTETSTGVVRIDDVSYEAMKCILKFIYTGKMDDNWMEFIKEIVHAAEKYELPLLKEFCDNTLATTCKPDNAWNLMDLSQLYGLKTAEYEIGEYFKANVNEIIQAKRSSQKN